MGKQAFKEDPPVGAPEWIVTFSDMVSLLVTFFVMLMSFSTMEPEDALRTTHNSLFQGMGGVVSPKRVPTGWDKSPDPLTIDFLVRGSSQKHTRPPEGLAKDVAEMGLKAAPGHCEADLTNLGDGLLISFAEEGAFESGSSIVPLALRKSLGNLADVLQHYPSVVVVSGFADSAEGGTDERRSLAFERARSTAEALLETGKFPPALVQVELGRKYQRTLNTASSDWDQRTVQVRVQAPSFARSNALEMRSDK
ncbi:MAG: hypothetical protein FJ299_11435 [Planctomycetes bacterium]|nr:hypothetical protein [Planctomycetota bacterium]